MMSYELLFNGYISVFFVKLFTSALSTCMYDNYTRRKQSSQGSFVPAMCTSAHTAAEDGAAKTSEDNTT